MNVINEVLETIKKFTVAQLLEFQKGLAEAFEVDPSQLAAPSAAPTGVADSSSEAEAEKTTKSLELKGFDAANKINIIKLVKEHKKLNLKDAKELVEEATRGGVVILEKVVDSDKEFIDKLKELSAVVELT